MRWIIHRAPKMRRCWRSITSSCVSSWPLPRNECTTTHWLNALTIAYSAFIASCIGIVPRLVLTFYAFLKRDFPLAIYRHRYFVLVAFLVLVLPGLVAGVWSWLDDEAIYSVLDSSQVRHMERIYDPESEKIGREREADTDVFMFGFYIQNNISVAFRCFAGGLLLGVGTLLVLFFNGMFMGSIAGHLTRLDYVDTFLPVCRWSRFF